MVAGRPGGAQHRQKVYWSGREISRRMSRYWPSMPVAVIAQSLYRGPLDPFPHERRSNTASATAWSARIAVPDGMGTRESQGMIATYASPALTVFLAIGSPR